jgi:hypothetical protein
VDEGTYYVVKKDKAGAQELAERTDPTN